MNTRTRRLLTGCLFTLHLTAFAHTDGTSQCIRATLNTCNAIDVYQAYTQCVDQGTQSCFSTEPSDYPTLNIERQDLRIATRHQLAKAKGLKRVQLQAKLIKTQF